MNSKSFILSFLILLHPFLGFSQTNVKPNEEEMEAMLNKALVKLESGSFGMYFEGITMGAKNPLDIFSLPAYKVFRGGYYFCDKENFEMNLAGMKSICDGKVFVMIDEVEKQVMVDSVSKEQAEGEFTVDQLTKYIGGQNAEGAKLEYKGKQKIKGKECHVLMATIIGSDPIQSSIFYVTTKETKLVLMAEKRESVYDIYWIASIGEAPSKHSYKVFLPNRELNSLYGYEVTDLRF